MQTNTQYTAKQPFALALVGPPLAGKTNVAMQFPAPYFLDADDKLANAVQRHPGKQFWWDCPLYKPDRTPIAPEQRWTYAAQCLKEALKSPLVKTIVIDSASAVSEMIKDHILNFGSKLTIAGEKVMEQTHWQPFGDLWRRLIIGCKASGKLLVVIFHDVTETDKLDGSISTRPAIPGALKNTIGGLFTDVWHAETKIGPDPKAPGKVRSLYFVRTQPTSRMALGNSLDLPAEFDFSWAEMVKRRPDLAQLDEPKQPLAEAAFAG